MINQIKVPAIVANKAHKAKKMRAANNSKSNVEHIIAPIVVNGFATQAQASLSIKISLIQMDSVSSSLSLSLSVYISRKNDDDDWFT